MRLYAIVFCTAMLQGCAHTQLNTSSSQDMDVDRADSLNIAGFHEEEHTNAPATGAKPRQERATAELVVRADYQPASGPAAAYTALHQTLYRTCPGGWNKNREWTAAEDGGFYLYISANCR